MKNTGLKCLSDDLMIDSEVKLTDLKQNRE